MFQLIHIFLFCNTALCHIIQSFFPACSQFRVQKLSDGAVYHIKDHLSKKGWSDHLGFLIECQIFDIAQFLKNFRSGGTGSDSAAFNLGTKLFVLDQLTCILHCKNHRTGIITLWRRCLALFDTQAVHREYITFFQVLQCGKKSGITRHILSRIICFIPAVFSCIRIFLFTSLIAGCAGSVSTTHGICCFSLRKRICGNF